jgi:competence protein ComEC
MTRFGSGVIFYCIGIAFALGILVESLRDVGLFGAAFLILLALALIVAGRGPSGVLLPNSLTIVTLAVLAFSAGLLRMDLAEMNARNPYLESLVGGQVNLNGVIKREPEERETTHHLYVETEYGLVLVITPLGDSWRYGDSVSMTGTLEKPESFETDLGRAFNYPGYLLARGVAYTLLYPQIEKTSEGGGNFLIARIFDSKQTFMNSIERWLPEPAAGLGEGLVLGVKRALGEDLETTFRRTGIIHIVVLSGYNMAIVSGFILMVLGAVFGRRISSIVGIVGIIIFAVMVGLSATVVRAAIMAVLILLLGLTGRIYLVLRGLVLAGVAMLIYNPYSLTFDVGFQLSFLATLGLILAAPYLDERLQLVPNKWISAREFLVATVATQIFVLPILLYQIGEFSGVAVIVNILVLPMVPIAMLLTFITGVAGMLSGSLAAPLSYLTYLSLSYMIVIAEWFGALPFAAFVVPPFPFWIVPLSYLLIGLVFWYLNRPPDPLKGWQIVEETPS